MRLHPSLLASLIATLLLGATSCGPSADAGSSVDAGYDALSSGDHSSALADFDSALAGMQASDARYLEAKVGQLRAQCYVDPTKAKADLLALGSSSGLKARDYRMIVTDLVTAATARAKGGNDADTEAAKKTITSAVEILQAGAKAFPDDPKWAVLITKVGDKAASLGASAALEGLSGLGYVGGD